MIQAVIPLVPRYAYNLQPWTVCIVTHAFADGACGVLPILARQYLRYDDDGLPLMDLGPVERATRHQRIAHGLEVSRTDALEATQRRQLILGQRRIFHVERIAVVFAI